MLLTFLTAGFLLLYAALILFYYTQWKKVENYQPASSTPSVFISVVIAARNEEHSLPHLISDLLAQDYPVHLWEAIIINDYSTDSTAELVSTLTGSNMRMVLPAVLSTESSKKRAIETGVNYAKGELIVITDADCRVGPYWVSTIAKFYEEKGAAFIAAPVKFSHDNSVLQIFQSLDFITLQGITAASVSANFHAMCNGANLAYTKQAFAIVNGFEGIDKVATGDDMLLMHKIWKNTPGKVYYLKSKEATVSTEPMKTWKGFFMQRKRWASKTLVYDDYRIIIVLAFILLLNALFFVLLIAAIINKTYWIHCVAFLVGKTIIEWPFVFSVAKFYDEQKLMRYFFLFQPLHIFYTVFVGLLSQFGKYEWKGRRTK
jgi:cellulose synthase/poly-beta-1,6-N-acetylglucosamine synthase-like glycosyltransferase